jgi:hypothetical protein
MKASFGKLVVKLANRTGAFSSAIEEENFGVVLLENANAMNALMHPIIK